MNEVVKEEVVVTKGQTWKCTKKLKRDTLYIDSVKKDKIVVKRDVDAVDSKTIHINTLRKEYKLI